MSQNTLDDLAPTIAQFRTAVRDGRYDAALNLFGNYLSHSLQFRFGAYQLCADLLSTLFRDGEDLVPPLSKESDQAWLQNELAVAYVRCGQSERALPLFEMAYKTYERLGVISVAAIPRAHIARVQISMGKLREAGEGLRSSINQSIHPWAGWLADNQNLFDFHSELGRLATYQVRFSDAETELDVSLTLARQRSVHQLEGVVWLYRAFNSLLMKGSRGGDRARSAISRPRTC